MLGASLARPQQSLLERVRAFGESLDLAQFGSLQYVHAEALGDRTIVREIWSEGALSMRDMFPDNKDTPGHDLPDLPRPPGSFRVVSAHIEGAGRNLVSYQSAQTPEQINAFYAKSMKAMGWEEVDLGERTADDGGPAAQHAYRKQGRTALLALTTGDELTDATFIEMPAQ